MLANNIRNDGVGSSNLSCGTNYPIDFSCLGMRPLGNVFGFASGKAPVEKSDAAHFVLGKDGERFANVRSVTPRRKCWKPAKRLGPIHRY